jgi:hypothetical protein
VRRKRTPAATSLARAASEFFHDDGLESGAPACVTADVLTNRLWLKRPTKSPDLPWRRFAADAYAATLPDEALWTRFVEEVEKLRTAGRIKPDEYYILRSSLESREALMAHPWRRAGGGQRAHGSPGEVQEENASSFRFARPGGNRIDPATKRANRRSAPVHVWLGDGLLKRPPQLMTGRASTSGSILRGKNWPSPGRPMSLPSRVITRPRRMVVVGQALISQPSHGL